MSYRQPAFMVDHILASAVTDADTDITGRNTTTLTEANKRKLVDYRPGEICEWVASGGSSGFIYDLGAGYASIDAPNRCVVPAGHNLNLQRMRLYTDSAVGIPSATQIEAWTNPDDTAVIDQAIDPVPTLEQFFMLQNIDTIAATTYYIPQLWVGTYTQLSATAAVDPYWGQSYFSDVIETEYPGGRVSTELAPPRRTFTLTVRNVAPGSADYTVLENVMTNGRARPFWFWPPEDTDPGPFLMKLETEAVRDQEFAAPSVSPLFRYSFSMIEQAI